MPDDRSVNLPGEPPPAAGRRSARSPWTRARRLASSGAGVVVGLLVLAHLPIVQRLVLDRATSWLGGRYGITVTASGLHYNLLALSASIDECRVSVPAGDGQSERVVALRNVHVVFGSSILLGRLDVHSLDAEAVVVRMRASAKTSRPAAAPKSPHGRFDLPAFTAGDVRVRHFAIEYADPGGMGLVSVLGGSLDLTGGAPRRLAGRFAIEGVSLDNGTLRLRTGRIDGRIRLDANGLAIEPGGIAVGPDLLRGRGQVMLTPAGGALDAGLEGSLRIDFLSDWVPALPRGQGRILARIHAVGQVATPQVSFEVETTGLTWPRVATPPARAEGVVSRAGIEISRLDIASAPARLSASARLGFGDGSSSAAHVLWSDVTPAVVARVLRARPPVVPSARTNGTASLSWKGLAPSRATLEAALTAAVAGPAGSGDAGELRVHATPREWHVEAEQRAGGGALARLDAFVTPDASRLTRSAITGSLEVRVDDARVTFDRVARFGGPLVKIPEIIERLPIDVTAQLSGALARPRATGVATSALSVPRVGAVQADAAFETTLETLTIRRLRVRDGDGNTIDASGAVAYGTLASTGSLEATATTEVLQRMLPADWHLAGSLSARGTWGGSLRNPVARAEFTGHDVAVNGLAHATLAAAADLRDGVLSVDGDVPALAARVSGKVALAKPFTLTATTTFENADLARLASMAPAGNGLADVRGALTSGVDVTAPLAALEQGSSRIRLQRLDARVAGHPLALAGPSQIFLSGSGLSVTGLRLESGAARLAADGSLDRAGGGSLGLKVDTPADEVAQWLEGVMPGMRVSAAGSVHLDARATGPIGATSLEGHSTLTIDNVTAGDRTVAENVRAEIDLRGNRIEARRIAATASGATVDIAGSAPIAWIGRYLPTPFALAPHGADGPANLKGRAVVPVATLLGWWGGGATPATGTITCAIDASATQPDIGAVEGTASITTDQLALQEMPFALARPVTLTVRAGRVSVDDAELRTTGASLALTGHSDLTDPFDVDLRLVASGGMGFIAAVVPGRASGRVDGDLRLSGPAGARTAVGMITLQQAGFVIPAGRLALADWSGRIDLSRESLSVSEVSGLVNGGSASLRGRLPLVPGTDDASMLSLSVRDAFVEVVKGFKSQVDADLTVGSVANGFRVAGDVTVASGAYREPVTAMAALFGEGASSSPAAQAPSQSALDQVSLDVRLRAHSPIILDNSVARLDMVPDMTLTGTAAHPAVTGSLDALRGGHVTLAGRQYRIREGRALFTQRGGWTPSVNVSGETRVGEYTISIRVTGPVNAIETTFTSIPPLSDRDLRSLLVTGQTASSGSSASQNDQQYALEAASSEIMGLAGQMIGLDSLQLGRADFDIGVTEVKPATRLTATKSLRETFRVILSENLDDNKLTWIIVLDPGRGYDFRFSQRDEGEHVVEFRQELEFGPGTSPERAPARAPDADPVRVSSLVFSGTPGMPASTLEEVVATRVGKPFDVAEWQNDRERLETFYSKAGYSTARVVPRRTVQATPRGERIGVEYHIDRGPRTVLQIDGTSLPDDVVNQIRAAWGDAVLPEFLRDEAIRIVRAYLAGRNCLRPSIDFSVDVPADAVQRVTLRVSPGPSVRSKTVVFDGKVSEADIKARPALRAAIDDAWVDTAPLLHEVETLYRERGYFGVRATADAIAFGREEARLAIRVVEGPPARIARVAFVGVNNARLARVRAAARLEPGAVFLPTTGREARTRVLDAYQDLGFRSVDVQVARTIADDGAVALTFTVSEGPQSIVSAVRVDGAQVTRAEAVNDAITLKPGDPAGYRQTADTQRRLYGIGTFRNADVRFEPAAGGAAGAGQIPVDAIVSLSEVRKYQLRYGLQVSDQNGPVTEDVSGALGVAADVRDRNFLGRGITVGASGRYELNQQNARAMVFLPRYLNQRLDSHLFLTFRKERTTENDATADDTERDLTFQQRLVVRRGVEVSWAYSYNSRDFVVVSAPTVTSTQAFPGRLSSLQFGLVLDRRDSPFDATHGWFHSENFELGMRFLGSDVAYTRYLLRQYVYLPVGPLVVATGLRWGTLGNVRGEPPLSIVDLFFDAGGAQTVRGYDQDSLSALTAFSVPVGGPALLIFNQEVRFPIFKWFKGAVFFDAGNSFLKTSGISLSGLALGAGFGLRIKTPLAPFRIDMGMPIGAFGDRKLRFYFSVGQMF